MAWKKYNKKEWEIAKRANALQLVFKKDFLQNRYIIYKKKRQSQYSKNNELINTTSMRDLDNWITRRERKNEGSWNTIKGDLIKLAQKGRFDVIAHGCNCFATFGAGIAPQIGRAFPEAQTADKTSPLEAIERLGNFTFGSDVYFDDQDQRFNLLTFNLYTQYMPGPDMQIEALALCFRKLAMELKEYPDWRDFKIGLPLIGCGIGGGDWNKVSKVIKKELEEFHVTIVEWEKEKLKL